MSIKSKLVKLLGCNAETNIAALYERAARQGVETRNPVVVIPGIMGTRLVSNINGKLAWSGKRAEYIDERDPEQARRLAHPMKLGEPLTTVATNAEPAGTVRRVQAGTGPVGVYVNAYGPILDALGVGGFLRPDKINGRHASAYPIYGDVALTTCFEFDYDWRLTLDRNSARLNRFIQAVSNFISHETKCTSPVKVDVVAHSMGGLLLRYYLRYGGAMLDADGNPPPLTWYGAKHVEFATLVATPSFGAINGLAHLVEGRRLGPVFPKLSPTMLCSAPTLYQLMPRPRHGGITEAGTGRRIDELYDADAWIDHGWGIAAADQLEPIARLVPDATSDAQRWEVAHDHLRKCLAAAKGFHDAIDYPAAPPEGATLSTHLFAAGCHETASVCALPIGKSEIEVVDYGPGDKVVLRSSALADERVGQVDYPRLITPEHWDSVTFIPADHMNLTRHPTFVDTTLHRLLERPRPRCGYRGGGTRWDDVQAEPHWEPTPVGV